MLIGYELGKPPEGAGGEAHDLAVRIRCAARVSTVRRFVVAVSLGGFVERAHQIHATRARGGARLIEHCPSLNGVAVRRWAWQDMTPSWAGSFRFPTHSSRRMRP